MDAIGKSRRPRWVLEGRQLGWALRAIVLLVVFTLALSGFQSGAGVSDRPGLPEAGLLAHIYYSAGLFVLGGLDLGTPVSGPPGARAMLWSAYFLAPLITTSAVIEGALRLVGSGALGRLRLRRHLVLVGLGRLAGTFVASIRDREPNRLVVALERDVGRPRAQQARRSYGLRVFSGDARLPGAFASLQLKHAGAVALLTNDDLLNLEVAHRLRRLYPHLPVVAHVSDVGLQRAALEVHARSGVHVFNSHRVVASYLYRTYLHPYFQGTLPKDAVVLAGFGRFGQAILELLAGSAAAALSRVVVVAPGAAQALRNFHAHVPLGDAFEVTALDADVGDVATWQEIETRLGSLVAPPVVVVGTQDESTNLQSSLEARTRWPRAPVFTRCENESAFSEELARQRGFTVLVVDSMLHKALRAAQREWFYPTAPLAPAAPPPPLGSTAGRVSGSSS